MEEAADGTATSVDGLSSKMQEEFANIGVSITDANGQIRSTYDILTDIGAQWPKLTQNQKAYYAELAAGKNQANIFIALMDNIGTAVAATGTAYDSAGSAAAENAKRMDSVEGKLEQFRAAWEKLSTSIISSDFIKNILEAATALIEFADSGAARATVQVIALAGAFGLIISKGSAIMKTFKGIGELKEVAKVFKGAEFAEAWEVFGDGAGNATKSVAGLVNAFKMLGGASVLGPIAALVAALAAVYIGINAYQDSLKKAHEENIKQTDSALESFTQQQKKVADLEQKLADVDAQMQSIRDKGELSITDENQLAILQQQRNELQLMLDMEKQIERQKANQARQEVGNELNDKIYYKAWDGMGSLSGKTIEASEAVRMLTGEYVSLNNQYNALNEDQKNGYMGNRLQRDMENVSEELSTQAGRYIELANKITGTDEQSIALKNALLDAADAGQKVLDNVSKVPGTFEGMANSLGLVDVNLKSGTKSVRELSNELTTTYAQFQAGETSARQFATTVQQGFDNINTEDFINKVQTSDEAFSQLTDSQQQEVLAAQATWMSYGEAVGEALQGVYDTFNANEPDASQQIQQMQDLQQQYMDYYTVANGLEYVNGQWQNQAGEIDAVAQYLQGAQDKTASWQGAVDALSGSQEFLGVVSQATAEGTADSAFWAAQQQTEAFQQAQDNFSTGMQSLYETNRGAWESIAATVAQVMGVDVSTIFDQTTGALKTESGVTADAVAKGFESMANQSKTAIDGIKTSTDGAFQGMSTKAQEAFKQIEAGKSAFESMKSSATTNGAAAEAAIKKVGDALTALDGKTVTTKIITQHIDTYETRKASGGVLGGLFGMGQAKGSDFIEESGFYTVGEAGRETVFLPRGAAVATASETRNMRGMLKSGRGGSGGGGEIDDDLNDSFKKIANSLVKVTKTLTGVSLSANGQQASASTPQSRSAGTARAASYDDPHKKNFDSAYDEIKYLQDMDRISEQDYLNRLENLNNSYFGGRMEYLEEYRRYEVEVYKGRKRLQEQAERDREKAEKDRIQAVKDGFEREADALEYMRDKDLITEDEYYRQLLALNNKYFKGKTDFLDEYQKYEIKVYDYLKKKEEERLKELKEQTEKQYENTRDHIVNLIDQQIDAEEGKLDQLDKEKNEQEKLLKIEEARKKLAEAQQQKVRVYRAGQGFVYESDAAAIEEASKELNELLEEEKFDKQKQGIEEEIKRLEDLKDAWQDSLDINEDLEKYGVLMEWIKAFEEANYDDRLAMAEQFGESYRKILADIAKAQENVSNTASSQLPNFKPNGYARGTNYVPKSEKAVVGENGPELVNLPKGSGVLTSQETKNMRMWGSIAPTDLFSSVYKMISSMPRYTFDTPTSGAPTFDFSSWNLDVDVDSGLVDAIQNSLRETVIQYISKRDR